MEGICVNVVKPGQFIWFLKGHCHGSQFWAKLAKWPSFSILSF